MRKVLGYIALFTLLLACGSGISYEDDVEFMGDRAYSDGTYCAEVDYYYPITNTQATYTLEVEIENDELVKIDFPNGGWLDESHFDAPDISSGNADFESDRGAEYSVQIIGDGGCGYSSSDYPDEDAFEAQLEEESAKKEEEETRKHTCPRCGSIEYYLYGDLCSSCKQEDEDDVNEDDFY